MIASHTGVEHHQAMIEDMTGPLPYWGPVQRLVPSEGELPLSPVIGGSGLVDALTALRRTLNGRTWTGTTALMTALLEEEASTVAGETS